MRAKFIVRLRIITSVFVFIALVIIVRLYMVQVVHGSEYRQSAENQHIAPSQNQLSRGSIFFTAKDSSLISAATIQSGFTLAVVPHAIKDADAAYASLAKSVDGIDKVSFIAKATKIDDPYEELGHRFSDAAGKAVVAANIPGVNAYRESWRLYPGATLGAHAIGFLGYGSSGTEVTGQAGLERSYNTELSRTGSGTHVNFFADLFTNVGTRIFSNAGGPGADLVTSIEPTVQAYLEDELAEYDTAWHAKIVGGIVMDPSTGAVIAIASRPTYDPNDIKNSDPRSLADPMTQGTYEFGSTMKPITMAAALDSHAVTPATTYNDTGFVMLDGKKVSNFDGKARGVVPMQQILSQSLNVGISWIVQKMGDKTLANYFEKFGITEETGIDLPGEASPQIGYLQNARTVQYVTAGFGQGVAITPIAMARALSTLANHGAVPAPHIGVELQYPGGITKTLGWAPPRQAITPQTADTITRMLVTVVDTALKNGEVKIPEMSVAAKTGTAQIANPAGGGYYADRYLHSFFGYFPAYDAKFLIFFFAVEPVGAQYASETWTGPFIDMTKFLTTYYAIPPDRAHNDGSAQ